MMRRSVFSDQPGTVQTEHYRKLLQSHVMQYLVMRTLKKSRVNGHERTQARFHKSGRERNAMLLGAVAPLKKSVKRQ